jgi:hypothetical protein
MWVVVVLVMLTNGKVDREVVIGDYYTKADCEAGKTALLKERLGVLECVKRRKGMKQHPEYFIGD